MHLSELKAKHVSELVDLANAMEIDGANRLRKHDLIFTMLKMHAKKGEGKPAAADKWCCPSA